MPEYITVRLHLFEGNHPKCGGGGRALYMPHVRVGTDGEYLGVAFVDGPEWIQPGSEVEQTLALMYTDTGVDYGPLQPGVRFEVLEGARAVADGVVLSRWSDTRDWRSLRERPNER